MVGLRLFPVVLSVTVIRPWIPLAVLGKVVIAKTVGIVGDTALSISGE